MKSMMYTCDCCGLGIDNPSSDAVRVTMFLSYEEFGKNIPYCTPTIKKTWCLGCISKAGLQPEMDTLKREGNQRKPEPKSSNEDTPEKNVPEFGVPFGPIWLEVIKL